MWVSFIHFGPNESDNRCSGEAATRQPPRKQWFAGGCHRSLPSPYPAWLIFLQFCFSKGKSIASDLPWPRIQSFLISAGSLRWYLQLIQVAQGIQLLQDIKSINVFTCIITPFGYVPPAQSQNCEKPTEHSSSISIFVQGGTGGSLPDPYRWPPVIMCMLLTNVSDSMGLA